MGLSYTGSSCLLIPERDGMQAGAGTAGQHDALH